MICYVLACLERTHRNTWRGRIKGSCLIQIYLERWLLQRCSRVVREPDLRSTGRGFESRPPRWRVQPWRFVYTHVPLSPSSIIWDEPMGGDARQLGWYPRAWRKVMAAYHPVYGFDHLQADCRGPGSAPELYAHFKYGTKFTIYVCYWVNSSSVLNIVCCSFCVLQGKVECKRHWHWELEDWRSASAVVLHIASTSDDLSSLLFVNCVCVLQLCHVAWKNQTCSQRQRNTCSCIPMFSK